MANLSRQERLLLAKQKREEEEACVASTTDVTDLLVGAHGVADSGGADAMAEELELFTAVEETTEEIRVESPPETVPTNRVLFRSAKKRHTLAEREAMHQVEADNDEARRHQEDERVLESKSLIRNLIVHEDAEEAKAALKPKGSIMGEENANMPDDTDDKDPEGERAAWEMREIERILRDIKQREDVIRDAEELERRRGLTDEQRAAEDAIIEASKPKVVKGPHKYQFMQKWYHKGAFFQDETQEDGDSIYLRDFQQPAVGDMTNREALPEPMRLRRGQFGLKGATKYTHLRDQDTTDHSSALCRNDNNEPAAKRRKKA